MPDASTIYAELQRIDVATGEVDAINIADTIWQTGDNTASITEDTISSGRYEAWVRKQIGTDVAKYFASLNPTTIKKWQLGQQNLVPGVVEGTQVVFSGTDLVPEGYKGYPHEPSPENSISKEDIASTSNYSFVNLVGSDSNGNTYEGVSITPVYVEPNNLGDPALFPILVDSKQLMPNDITTSFDHFFSLKYDFTAKFMAGDTKIFYILTPVSKLDVGDTTDGVFGIATLKYIGAGIDPSAEARRTAILQSSDFSGSSKEVWAAGSFTAKQ